MAVQLSRFSVGTGDRFAHQAKAQLAASILAAKAGVEISPVWNKSNREHNIIGSEPVQTREAVDAAIKELGWTKPYFLDADHITLATVERFLEPSNFYTIDVAEMIGKPADAADVEAFVGRHPELIGTVTIPGIAEPFHTDKAFVTAVANKFLAAVQDAGKIYRFIAEKKGEGNFVPEVSMDETDAPQTPVELLIILAAIADEKIPIQTIAPKFTGRFNKGVDYVGDVAQFEREFNEDIAAIAFAVKTYGLPANLKLSVHSGSDKFSIYKAIHDAVTRTGAGVHLKTAGTTWLEELIGLAEAGGSGLEIAKEVYREAYGHREELCAPYATVIDIDPTKLPSPEEVNGWTSEQYVSALRHDQSNPAYNPSLRQLLHVGFKVAAKMGDRYLKALEANEEVVARNVTTNLFDRHIRPVFLGS
ncbi:MAG: tagaturonate epimerase family protein [Edaphobacter sp.]|uniref:tagaturonate epimerase family protein n=1 Tax=Edaphobacter sp. TaxID=1934404 RepID=UPI0023A4F4E5|nr:tagaturonate epimerase family protein [Edaphobacter sp.]MDE1175243.1 tagaturonate epimerase family protein [Edaphobacter sp.]